MASRGNQNNASLDWSAAELAILAAYADPDVTLDEVQRGLPGRSRQGILCKASTAGVTRRRRLGQINALQRKLFENSTTFNLSPDELGEFAGHRR